MVLSAKNYYDFSSVYNRRENNYQQTVFFLKKASEIAYTNNDIEFVTYESWLGYTQSLMGEREEAIEHLYNSLHYVQNRNLISKYPWVHLLFGFFYKNNGELEKASLQFQKSIDASNQIGDSSSIQTALHELGNLFFMQNRYDEALKFQKKALQIRKQSNNKAEIMYSYTDIGITFLYLDSLEQALDYFKKAAKLAIELNEKWVLINVYSNMNDVYLRINKPQRVVPIMDSMQHLANELKIKTAFFLNYGVRYNYYKQNQQFEKALENYELMQIYRDSISNESVQQNISELEKKYNTLKKDQEQAQKQVQIKNQKQYLLIALGVVIIVLFFLALVYRLFKQKIKVVQKLELLNIEILKQKEELNARNEEIIQLNEHLEKANQELTKLMATKNKFFSIIAHDLKNPFNILLGYNQLILENTSDISQDEVKRFAGQMYETSKKTYDLLENLLEWSRLQTGNLVPKPVEFFPDALINSVYAICEPIATAKKITIKTELNANLPLFADLNMITTVLRNLMTNAIKYSFPDSQIILTVQWIEKNIQFRVSDSGIGMDSGELEKLFQVGKIGSRKGTAQEMGTGLGLILCKEFIEQNGGTIGVSSTPGKGSDFWFSLPLSLKIK